MFQEVLEVQDYPSVAFDSTEIVPEKQNESLYKVTVAGQLALHGVTNIHTFNAQVALGVDSFRAYGEFLLQQPNYNIAIASIAGGSMRLREELKFSFYVVARKAS
jgi:polyisoprenoid-binding protein YceI